VIKFIFVIFFLTINVSANNLEKVSLQLSWFDQFQFAGYYIAKEKGFYKEVGLDVDIKPFKFGINVASLLIIIKLTLELIEKLLS
jgi:ABC-type nitrate/sulfonate/bicarbonate transport system substrate-binding protein